MHTQLGKVKVYLHLRKKEKVCTGMMGMASKYIVESVLLLRQPQVRRQV